MASLPPIFATFFIVIISSY